MSAVDEMIPRDQQARFRTGQHVDLSLTTDQTLGANEMVFGRGQNPDRSPPVQSNPILQCSELV